MENRKSLPSMHVFVIETFTVKEIEKMYRKNQANEI